MPARRRTPADAGVTFETVSAVARKLLPGVVEATSYGTPALKVRGKLIARLREDGETLVLRMDLVSREYVLRSNPELWCLTEHYRDYPYVLLRLPVVERRHLPQILEDAWRLVAPKRLVAEFDATRRPH
jgi:hypothetical protein